MKRRSIDRQARLDLFDGMRIRDLDWFGDLDDVAFLGRIWDLTSMRSTDSRYRDAAGEVHQHRINNHDWDDDWLYTDARFDLLGCDDEIFLRFCEQLVHPVVRRDPAKAGALLGLINDALGAAGWKLVAQASRVAGLPIHRASKAGHERAGTVVEASLHERVADPALFEQHAHRIEAGLRDDPPAAIGSAKELVETTCRVILDDRGIAHNSRDGISDLYRKVSVELGLRTGSVPDDSAASEAANGALRNLAAAVQNLAEMRNALGTGHGRATRSAALERHARLAVGAAVTISRFLMDTWHARAAELERS